MRFLTWHSPYLNSILLSRHFVNTFSTYWIWPSSNLLQQRKKRTITTNLLGTRGGVNTVTRRVDLLSSAFHLFFLFGWQVFGPLTAREESLNGKKDTWVIFIMFCLFPYVTLLLAMAFYSICQKNDEVWCATTTNIYTKFTCLISYSSRIDVVLIWNFVGTGYKRESKNKHEDFPIDIKYLITGDRLKLFWPRQLQCLYVHPKQQI